MVTYLINTPSKKYSTISIILELSSLPIQILMIPYLLILLLIPSIKKLLNIIILTIFYQMILTLSILSGKIIHIYSIIAIITLIIVQILIILLITRIILIIPKILMLILAILILFVIIIIILIFNLNLIILMVI